MAVKEENDRLGGRSERERGAEAAVKEENDRLGGRSGRERGGRCGCVWSTTSHIAFSVCHKL